MVHRSGSTLILSPNDADRKKFFDNNHDDGPPNESQIFTDSQNLPQFLDGLDPCAVPTGIQTKKSTTTKLPSNDAARTTTTTTKSEISIVSTPRTPRSLVQNNKKSRKPLTTPKTTTQTRCSNNETPDVSNDDDTNRISPPFRIRSGLRSNSLESNVFLRPNNDAIISGLVTPRRRGRKMRKKRKDVGELKKCKSAEIICDDKRQVEDFVHEEYPIKLTCSLPLERLSGFLDTILLRKRYNLSDSKLSTEITTDTAEEDSPNLVNNVDNDDSQGHSSHLTTTKSLCLYCDKKFFSQKVRIKHTERVHAISKGRRLSSRNSMSCSSNLSFPGCSYCCYNSNKLKIVTVSDDLKSLFHHLLDFHSDRYFACKLCAIRFTNSEDLETHFDEKHKAGCSSSSKIKNIPIKKKGKNSPLDNSFGVDTIKTTTQALHIDTTTTSSSSDKASSLGDDASNDPESTPTKTRRQLKQAMENKPLTTRSCQNVLRNDEAILSRLGVAQNRLPRGRRGIRNRRICNIEQPLKVDCLPNAIKTRSKVGRVAASIVMDPMEPTSSRPLTNSRVEVLSCTFDEDFYETVSFNVRTNLSCHLDGKLDSSPTSPSPLSPVATVPTVRSTFVKSPLNADSEIHEATTLATVTAFPTLLTAEQYGSDIVGSTKIKRPITKHSWKWKWDCVKKYKYVNEGGKIVKKVKQPVAGFRDLSKLDMWTQLTMRSKHEMAKRRHNALSGLNELFGIGEAAREEKRKQIAQLNAILDTRRLPQIILEQSEQTVIKLEISDESTTLTASSPIGGETTPPLLLPLESRICDLRHANNDYEGFPKMLHLNRRDLETNDSQEDIILSGEWARPRFYICFGCGAKFDKLKTLEEHKVFRHPYVYSTHYEIVGRELIEGDLFKHFYIPTKALSRYKEYKQRLTKKLECDGKIGFNENSTCGEESMDSVNSVPISYTTGTSRSDCDTESKTIFASTSSSDATSIEIEGGSILKFHGNCTKCNRECGGILELYRHMLDCSGDYAWILAKKKKYRYFGVRRKRNARNNLPLPRRKINNKDANVKTENDGNQKPKIYSKPSDAESIRRMLENLPAKRACRQIIPNITKPRVRKNPKGILVKGKNGKKLKSNMANTTVTAITKRILRNHNNKRIYTRHLRQVRTAKQKKQNTTITPKNGKNDRKKNNNVKKSITIDNDHQLTTELTKNYEEKEQQSSSSCSSKVVVEVAVEDDKEEEEDEEEEQEEKKEKDAMVVVVENQKDEKISARSAASKNVVKALGKKTRRFVKKITDKFQSNTKAFLNKRKSNRRNITASSSSSSSGSISSSNSNSSTDTAETDVAPPPPPPLSKNQQSDNGKTTQEENYKKQKENDKNKETENKINTTTKMSSSKKQFLKGNSKILLRKLSFRKSSRTNQLSTHSPPPLKLLSSHEEIENTSQAYVAAANEEVCTFNDKTNANNTTKVVVDENDTLDKKNKNVNISSTNLQTAQTEKILTKKKKKTFKKILNKFKNNKSNKKFSNSKETENKPDTAVMMNVNENYNDNDIDKRNCEIDTHCDADGNSGGGGGGVGYGSTDDKIINNDYNKEDIVIENCESSNQKIVDLTTVEKAIMIKQPPVNDNTNNISISVDDNIQPLNLSIPTQQPTLQVSPTTKRRSKKLTDCIAMLTGKLQEKLGKPFFESTENLDSALSRQSSTTDISTITPQDTSNISSFFNTDNNISSGGALNLECGKKFALDDCFERKPPKRKTVTRKIIKKGNNNCSDTTVNKETIFSGGGGYGGSSNSSGGNVTSSTSIVLRPPVLKVSSPKQGTYSYETASTFSSGVCNFKMDKSNNIEIDTDVIANKIKIPNEQNCGNQNKEKIVVSQIIPASTKLDHVVEVIKTDQPQRSTNLTSISNLINDNNMSSINFDKKLDNSRIEQKDETPMSNALKGRKKVVRKVGRKKQSSIAKVVDKILIEKDTAKCNKSDDCGAINKTSSNIPEVSISIVNIKKTSNVIVKDEDEQSRISSCVVMSMTDKNLPTSSVTSDKKNLPKKKPGRKPKPTLSITPTTAITTTTTTIPENNEDESSRIDDSEHSHKLWEISKNCDIIPLIKENDGDKKLNKLLLQHQNDEKSWNKINLTTSKNQFPPLTAAVAAASSSSSPSAHTFSEGCYQSSKISSTDNTIFAVSNDVLLIDNDNNITKEKINIKTTTQTNKMVGAGSKKVGKRKVKTGNTLNSTKKGNETVDNILEDINDDKEKPLEKKIKLTATDKPISSDVVITKDEENPPQSTLTTSKYISLTQNKNNTKGRQKKSDVGKNIIKKNYIETVCNVTTIPTTTTSSSSKLLETNKNDPQAASECGVKQQQIEEIPSLPLKRKPGRKKKIKEIPFIEEILNKPEKQIAIEKLNTEKVDNKISDIVINKLESNQNSQQSSTIVKQPETKKYTRKTKLKSDSKPSSSSDPFVNAKSFLDNTAINLHDENQLIANPSENVTLKSTLPPLSPNNHHQPISLKTIVSEEKSIKKNKKNIKVGNNPKGGKSLSRTNSGKIELCSSVQALELENNGNILLESSARNMKTTPIKDIRSTKTPPSVQTQNLMNIKEKNVLKEKSLTTTTPTLNKSRSSNRNKLTKSNEINKKLCHNHALTEVEEIVASFFTDDVADNDDDNDLLLKKKNAKSEQTSMTDKPIRLDDAEAILSEQHDDDLDDNNEENTITISCSKEKQNNITTPEAITLLVDKDEVVVSGSNNSSTADDNILQLSSLPVNNPVNVNNENILSICRELSVSLVKLPEDTVNSMKESIISKDNTSTTTTIASITKKKGKNIFSSSKQKNQRNDILDIISNKIDPKAQEKEDILELKLNGPKSKSKELPAEIDVTIIPSVEIFQNINKTMQEKMPESTLEGENGKMEKLDEISSTYSTLKSQECNSETDTRPDSAAKKQRKRRKNELAAIVADQLLESFKEVDKSKIDDLKMLENLAYEKSEDLLLTGMRLTPTTKRINQPIADNSKDNIMNHQPLNNKEMKSQKRKSNEQHSSNRKLLSRSKSQPNLKKLSIESTTTTTPPSSNQNDVVDSNDMESREKEDDEILTKKRKSSEMCISNSHENLFRSFVKHDEPLKLNAEPLSTYRHNLKICSNFNTTQFEVFSTFKNSFDTFRSLTDFSFMNKKDIVRKSNFIPGSTETSNSVDDSQSLKQEDVTTTPTAITTTTKPCDTGAAAAAVIGDKIKVSSSSSSSVHKKLKKKLLRKKEKKSENENINQLRTGLELFSFEKETCKNNKDILVSKSFDSKNLNSNDERQTRSAIISKSHFSFSSPDLFNNVTIKSTDFAQSFNENKKPLLRPSILTATLQETPRTSITLDSSLTTTEVSKSISSRDPRLNKNKIQINCEDKDKKEPKYFERRKMGSIRQRRKSESNLKKIQTDSDIEDLNTAFLQPKVRLRSGRKEKKLKSSTPIDNDNIIKSSEPESRTEEDDDNYLSQMAKCVNDKIMSSEDEDDGFEMCNTDSALLLASESGTHPRPSTSMSLRSMPNFNDDQSNAEFLQEDDNTNTELIDMDLEDDMSVYTSFSQDVSRFTGRGGKFGTKRRRRKSILFTRKPKKQNTITDQSEEIFNCDICNKNFRKAAALGKHQMTLTHIAKLSEHEYLNASKVSSVTEEPERQQEPPKNFQSNVDDNNIEKPTAEDSHQSDSIMEMEMEDKESEPIEELVNEGEAAAAMPVETEVPPEPEDNVVIEKSSPPPPQHQSTPSVINLLNQSGIEPISSPEQVESNYDRYQNISSRITLSQEERLFYECCNMLKGSETPMVERTYPIVPYSAYDVPNKPVTPKSSERFSYLGSEVTGNFHHGTAYTVKSPMSQSRTSPRHAYPKIDVNQFSDISSDSNPAFPRAQPHPNLQSNLNYPSLDLGANKAFSSYAHHPPQSSPGREAQNNSTTGIASFGQAVPTHNYQEPFFSGEGSFTPTQFPNVTDGNPASLTARTFVNEHHVKDFNAGRENIAIPAYPSEIAHDRNQRIPVQQNQNFISPIHSTSSEGSITTTICRMKTKAAMKGYDNFKVSIPTLGLDMQQALERSPHGGCKLTALAEIALGSEAPITSSSSHYPSIQMREEEICDKSKVKPDINEKFAKKYQELIKSNMEPAVPKTPKKKEAIEKIGNKLGFRAKKSNNKGRASKNCEVSKSPEKPKDIYEFDDSEEMEPNEIKSPIRGGRTGKQNEEKIVIPERPFKDIGLVEQQGIKFHKPDELNNQNEESLVSSTSYSDRDDFNYGSMSDNEDANQDEEGSSESESNSSARTTKTIENKCLIMGRIFKKATKNRPEDNSKVDEKITPEQKKKLPTQELNKLFDSLRSEIKETDVHEPSPTIAETNIENLLHDDNDIPAQTAAVVVNLSVKPNDSSLLSSKKGVHCKKENPTLNEQNNKQQELNQTEIVNTEDLKALECKPSEVEAKGRKEIRRRSRRDTTQQHSKEISKLQSELGMSAEEIVNLISEGKRKSQRRCAANRVQKFVETWSSDEYEDFLSTKDIIAFIEEKEKKTRKRKSTSRNSEKKKSTDIVTTSTKVENCSASNTQSKPDKLKEPDAERNSNNSKVATNSIENSSNNKKSEKIVDKLLEKITKAQKGVNSSGGKNNKEECAKISDGSSAKINKEKNHPTVVAQSPKSPPLPSIKPSIKTTVETIIQQKKPTLSAKPRLKNRTADSESDFEAELRQSRTKIKKRRKTISFKERESGKKQLKPADASRKLSGKSSKPNNTSKGNSTVRKSSSQADGGGGAAAASKPQARRKRVASEMLYYWSSSSDEEFGRIEARDDDDDDDIAPEGEHYQQHGWIVGDSHKKLVTLLAIAKGKKVEDCGVKEAGYKKKS